jgi:hypothetical protein
MICRNPEFLYYIYLAHRDTKLSVHLNRLTTWEMSRTRRLRGNRKPWAPPRKSKKKKLVTPEMKRSKKKDMSTD